jgi:Leucine-rich repeat (LRR) protein
MVNLTHLTSLDLVNNPLTSLPPEMCAAWAKNIQPQGLCTP